MYSKISILLILVLLGFNTHAEIMATEQAQIQSKIINDSSVVINGPIYIVSNSSVEVINFPNLEFLNGPIYIVNNMNLKTISFPKLNFVNGPIYITYNSSLEATDFSHDMFVNGPIYYFMNKFE